VLKRHALSSSIGALHVYLVEYPRRHLQADANRLVMPIVLAFLLLSLLLRYQVGISPYYPADVSGGRIAALGLVFCLLPCAAPLVLLALLEGFRKRPDARFWLICLLSIAAPFVNQYGAYLLGSLAPATGAASEFVRHNGYDLRAIVCYLAAPLLYWLVTPSIRKGPFFGLTRRGFVGSAYALILLLAVPLLVAASFRPDFLASYPRYEPGIVSVPRGLHFWQSVGIFELLYGIQFIALEVFFRGFMVMSLEPYIGSCSVPVMMCAYCFIHFVKPMPEALTSIFGGYFLGVVAIYSRTVLGGILVHIGIALMLEVLSFMRHAGVF
jgi:CAAX prenyl protease-like protein